MPATSGSEPGGEKSTIDYIFSMDDGRCFHFEVHPDRPMSAPPDRLAGAEWTHLTFEQCPGCPLAPSEHKHCPAALDVQAIATVFSDILSYERTRVEVTTPERAFLKETDVQTGLRGLLGLVMAPVAARCCTSSRGLPIITCHLRRLKRRLFERSRFICSGSTSCTATAGNPT